MGSNGSTAWLSRGFEELLYERAHAAEDPARPFGFDVVVVGSGYGGAVAAAHLAGCTNPDGSALSLCILERGKEYLPGMFPSRFSDLAGHVRFSTARSAGPRGVREGLFDMRVGPDVCALLASGLGGGSLINAGVMEQPAAEIFGDAWPAAFRDTAARDALYERARRLVGAADARGPNTILRHESPAPPKYRALEKLSPRRFRPAAITVAMERKATGAGAALTACNRCGDCATGCNHGAKESLDLNLIAQAWRRRAKVYTGATVLRLERGPGVAGDEPGWILHVAHTDEKLRSREGRPLKLRARHVVLAAGTFGSTEILLRSQGEALRFSPRLGQGFSANGDMLAAAYKMDVEANAVADEAVPPGRRGVGPTITGVIDLRHDGAGHVVEEMAIPGALRRAFEESVTTVQALHQLPVPDRGDHDPRDPSQARDPCAVDPAAIRNSLVLAVMGRDDADGSGSLELAGGAGAHDGDGALVVRWPDLREAPLFGAQIEALRTMAQDSTGGAILPNPLWQLLPGRMQFLLEGGRGPLLTVHPLGGCGMGRHAGEGVVDHAGRVFDARAGATARTFPGLVVLDGSIVPCALGTNPALTIAALALRAVEELRDTRWGFGRPAGEDEPLPPRPVFRQLPEPHEPKPTEVQLIERMSGPATLKDASGASVYCRVELTLPFEPCSVASLMRPERALKRTLRVSTAPARRGEVRIFREADWEQWRRDGEPEAKAGAIVIARATVSGTLDFLHREPSTRWQRTLRAFWAYAANRGMRDAWQWLAGPRRERLWTAIAQRVRDSLALASHGGEVRLFEYELAIGEVLTDRLGLLRAPASARIRGIKRLTYARRSNPWRQLMRMKLLAFPGLAQDEAPVLDLDPRYLARERVPLLCITGQQDQPTALADLASLLAYFLRLLLNLHVWSFRRPDDPTPREPQRLPGVVAGLPAPLIRELEVDRLRDGTPVMVRLTRYRPSRASARPVVLIHGYSASGTTFAHPAVRPNLAEWLCGLGRDVWILDLRTSSGMPTARHPWAFEDAALQDLPAALAHIRREAGHGQLDVVAHCMGAAMLGMAVLKRPSPGERYFQERQALPRWIRRAVLSQIAPVVVMSPANIFRAYVLSYLRHFLPLAGYDFRVKPHPGLVDQLIDRLLSTTPYPEEEFDAENPFWRPWRRTPFAGTRHRMDALYGRDFSLTDRQGRLLLDERVLEAIDDLFGPLSIDTVAQGIHFARLQVIATRTGRNEYVDTKTVRERWIFPTLSVHGVENGLADVATLARIEKVLVEDAGAPFETLAFEDFGHQDSLIGRKAPLVFDAIARFLAKGGA